MLSLTYSVHPPANQPSWSPLPGLPPPGPEVGQDGSERSGLGSSPSSAIAIAPISSFLVPPGWMMTRRELGTPKTPHRELGECQRLLSWGQGPCSSGPCNLAKEPVWPHAEKCFVGLLDCPRAGLPELSHQAGYFLMSPCYLPLP